MTGEGFEPVEWIEGDPSKGLLLICDHASNALPEIYGSLGLPPEEFSRHIAYDIGARAVTLGLAQVLGVPAVLSTFSRLLIDPNRGEDDPTLVMRLSDGTVIPGNHPIEPSEIDYRIANFHRPYHEAVDQAIENIFAEGITPAVFSVHSFTGSWRGQPRPWHATLLWDHDPRFTRPLLEEFGRVEGMVFADNEPYDGALRNDTMFRHCSMRGLAHTLIELRQDLVGDEAGVKHWVDLLAPMLRRVNALAEVHEVRHFESRTGPLQHLLRDR